MSWATCVLCSSAYSKQYTLMQRASKIHSLGYVRKPRQPYRIVCGIYMLHYLDKVKCYVEKHQPRSLVNVVSLPTIDPFNNASA